MTTSTDTLDIILQTDASGAPVRLEYVRGRLKVEASPATHTLPAAFALRCGCQISIP